MKLTKGFYDKIIRMMLRIVPFIPGPELYDIFDELKKSNKTIDEKIDKAYNSLKNTANLVEELQKELSERADKIKELKEKYEHYNKLAEVEQEKAKAFLKELSETVNKNKGKERAVAFLISIIAGLIIFLIGIFASPYVKKWVGVNDTIIQNKYDTINHSPDTVTREQVMHKNIYNSKDTFNQEKQHPTKNIVHLADSVKYEDNRNK